MMFVAARSMRLSAAADKAAPRAVRMRRRRCGLPAEAQAGAGADDVLGSRGRRLD
jgi:hypothetical protein